MRVTKAMLFAISFTSAILAYGQPAAALVAVEKLSAPIVIIPAGAFVMGSNAVQTKEAT